MGSWRKWLGGGAEDSTADAGWDDVWVTASDRTARTISSPMLIGCLVAVLGVAAAVWLRFTLGFTEVARPGLILLVVPILLAAHIGGIVPGLLAAALAILGGEHFLMPRQSPLAILHIANAVQLSVLGLVGLLAGGLSEARLRARHRLDGMRTLQAVTLASIGDAVVVTDVKGCVRFLNPKATELSGWSLAEAKHLPLPSVFRVLNELTEEACENAVEKVLAHGHPIGPGDHALLVARDGRCIPITDSAAPIRSPSGALVGAVLIFRDNTRDRRVELGLQRQIELQDRLTQIAASVPGVICAVRRRLDGSVSIPVASPAFALVFDLAAEAVRDDVTPLLASVHRDDQSALRSGLASSARTLNPWHFTFRYHHKDKGERWIEGDAVPQTEADGGVIWHGFLADVTERVGIDAQLRQAQKMEAIGTLTGGMAHDFNNLLGVIIGNLDLARARLPDGMEASELVDEAIDAALRGAELTTRLLAFARRQPLQPVRMVLNGLIADLAKLLDRTLGETIQITLDLAPDLHATLIDPALLEASLTNLATNARDAMPQGGRLSIVTANRHLDAEYAVAYPEVIPGDYVMVEVTDGGVGMSAEVQARVFEPFFSTKAHGAGSGLGLSMVFGFVKQSNGHVAVVSAPGRGTTVRLYMPRAPVADDVSIPDKAATPAPGHGEIVLIVEDNGTLRRVAVRQLRDIGYQVFEADGPITALAIMMQERIDLVFSDIVMPGSMDGFDLADEVRQRWPHAKVLLTSGFPGVTMTDQLAMRGKSVHLLGKPYRREELAQALHEALRE